MILRTLFVMLLLLGSPFFYGYGNPANPSIFEFGYLTLDGSLSDSTKVARATTTPVLESPFYVAFFPEGGQLVNGHLNQIAFKVMDANGVGLEVSGEIREGNNIKVRDIATTKLGVGKFQLLPRNGIAYKAFIHHKGKFHEFELPRSNAEGVVMQVIEHPNRFQINISSTFRRGIDGFSFVAEQRQGTILHSNLKGQESGAIVTLPKEDLQHGVVQLALFNNLGEMISQRLVFHKQEETVSKVHLLPSKSEFRQQEKVSLRIHLAPSIDEGRGRASLSVIKVDEPSAPASQNLDFQDDEAKQLLDILLMTKDVRTYGSSLGTSSHFSGKRTVLEKGVTLSGTIKKSVDHQSVPALVSLSYKNDDAIGYDQVQTDENGRFEFRNLDFPDTTMVILQAKKLNMGRHKKVSKEQQTSDVFISLDNVGHQQVAVGEAMNELFPNLNLNEGKRNIQGDSKEIYTLDADDHTIILEEVKVESDESKKKEYYAKRRLLIKDPSHTVDFDEVPKTLIGSGSLLNVLQGRLPGVSIRGNAIYLRGNSSLKGNNQALILIDNMPTDSSAVLGLSLHEIDFIDIVKGPRTAIYGARAGNGIVAIYTKTGVQKQTEKKTKIAILSFKHPGLVQAGQNTSEKNKTKKGDVLFWNPDVVLDKPETTISFNTADAAGTYQIVLDGVTPSGEPLLARTYIEVK